MKKWMLLPLLMSVMSIAQEVPQPPPPPPGPNPDPAVQAIIDADLVDPTSPGGEFPGGPPSGPVESTQPSSLPTSRPTTGPTTESLTTAPTTSAVDDGPPPATGPIPPRTGFQRDRYSRGGDRTAPPSTAYPRTVAAAKPVSRDYDLVLARSIFVKGDQRVAPDFVPGVRPSTYVPSTPQTPNVGMLPHPEKDILFNGAMDADGTLLALFEDTAAAKVLVLKVGEKVAQGKIAAMTLGTVDYDDGHGKVKHILMGQNLDGDVIAVSTTRPSMTTTATTGPSPDGASPAAGPGGDILERMRLRRLQGK